MNVIIYYLLLIVPFVDLITAFTERMFPNIISIGTIFKPCIIIFSYIYVFFITKSKYKKKSIIYYSLLLLYIIGYFITKPDIVLYVTELSFLLKVMFLPIVLVFLYNYIEDHKINYQEIIKLLKYNLIFISIIILVGFITKTDFPAYVKENIGSVGWFYSANEVGTILTMLFPFLFIDILEKNKLTITYIIISILAMLLVGTKVSFLGSIFPIVLLLIYLLFKEKFDKNLLKTSSLIISFLLFIMILFPYSSLAKVIEYYKSFNGGNGISLSSSRDIMLDEISRIYEKSDTIDKVMGIGFTDRESINNPLITKAIEMDFYDIFYRYGFIGMIVFFIPMSFLLIYMLRYLIVHIRNYNLDIATIIYSAGISCLIAIIAGHVFTAPSVSLYLAIIMVLFVKKMKENNIKFY